MYKQEQRKMLQEIEVKAKKAHRKGRCLVPGCGKKSIRSHVISKKTLKLIADKEGKVLTWLPQIKKPGYDMYQALMTGQTWEPLQKDPEPISINGHDFKVTEPLFCKEHDHIIFKPIEGDNEISLKDDPDPEQTLPLAYRALCSAAFGTIAVNQLTDPYEVMMPELHQAKKRLQVEGDVLQLIQLYEGMRLTQQYDQLGHLIYSVDLRPCIASSYTFFPWEGNEMAEVASGKKAFPIENGINFSLLPHKPSNKSVCIISFLKTNPKADQWLAEYNINNLLKRELKEIFLTIAFQSPSTLYLSPGWWHSLPHKKQEEYRQIGLASNKRHADLYKFVTSYKGIEP